MQTVRISLAYIRVQDARGGILLWPDGQSKVSQSPESKLMGLLHPKVKSLSIMSVIEIFQVQYFASGPPSPSDTQLKRIESEVA